MTVLAYLRLCRRPAGINIYLAYQVVGQRVLTYQQAMTAIFLEGFIFMFLSMTGIRGGIIRYMPANIAFAASVGIGLLLAHTGLRNLGIIVFDPNTLVTLGGCPEGAHEHVFTLPGNVANATTDIADLTLAEPTVYACAGAVMRSATMWLGIGGGMLMAMLSAWRVKGALFIGIAFITVISWIPGHAASYLGAGSSIPGGAFRMQVFKQVVAAPSLSATALAWDWSAIGGGHFWLVLFTFLYIDLLDCTGILLAMASLLDDCMMQDAAGDGLLDVYEPFLSDKKEFKGQQWAFLSDGVGIVAGSMMGVTPVAVYLESAAGIEDGGRTGIVGTFICGVVKRQRCAGLTKI